MLRSVAIDDLEEVVEDVVKTTPFIDIHTHLFAPAFGQLGLWGIDELLTYHYLEAELFRFSPIRPEHYWSLEKPQQAYLVWKTLFIENTPVSEAARGIIAILHAFGLDTTSASLSPLREFFRNQDPYAHTTRVLRLSGVSDVVMTNDPLDPQEVLVWSRRLEQDERFHAALRLDRILNQWETHWEVLAQQGYSVDADGAGKTVSEIRRFLTTWVERMSPLYMAVSLPDSFVFPADDLRTKMLAQAVLPMCSELRLPLALMIGVRRQINPALRLAGDGSGRADLRALENISLQFPDNKFLVSVLSRENQHELCVYARKFSNLLPFGCWWFLNAPSIVEEVTRERLELLGMSFIPQHSDARVLEQLIYKWRNTRRTIVPILLETYRLLFEDGRPVTPDDVRRDVTRLFRTNFQQHTNRG